MIPRTIERVSQFSFLGIMIDEHFTWKITLT